MELTWLGLQEYCNTKIGFVMCCDVKRFVKEIDFKIIIM